MANKQAVFTFHQVREKCQQADADGWRAFFHLYAPLSLQLLKIYGADDSPVWERTVDALTQNDFARLRAMSQQSEREFLMELRAELLERAAAGGTESQGAGDALPEGGPVLDLQRIATAFEGLPLLHQEILWFKMAGYTDATLERILRMSPEVARTAMERLMPDFSAIRELTSDRCPWPRSWLALLQQARASKKEDCPILHQLLRIHDGQVSWYDKEPVERRVAGCRHCLDNWTGLREVAYWRRLAAPAIPPERIDQWLGRVPVREIKRKSIFQRATH